MARTQKDIKLRRKMCGRLKELVFDHLKVGVSELSRNLHYSNSAALHRALKGEVFPDTERLATLATIKTDDGSTPNIHWLITGKGSPLIKKHNKGLGSKLESVIASLSNDKAEALIDLLSN